MVVYPRDGDYSSDPCARAEVVVDLAGERV